MARDLLQNSRNELKIRDGVSGDELVLYYRLPTTKERIAFQKACYKEVKGKFVNQTLAARAAYGALILTGIRDGDFAAGKEPLSSTIGAPGYREDWKKLVEETAGDLLMVLGLQVFDTTTQHLLQQGLIKTEEAAPEDEEAQPEGEEEIGMPDVSALEGGDIGPLAQS